MFCSPVQKNMCACVKKWAELTAHWRLETEEFRCSSQTMASSGLADFWRRRRLPILVGLIVLCIIVTFMHLRNRGLRKHQQVSPLLKDGASEKQAKPLPPMHVFVKSGNNAKELDEWKQAMNGADGKGLDEWKAYENDKGVELEEGKKDGIADKTAVQLDGDKGDGKDGDKEYDLFPGGKKDDIEGGNMGDVKGADVEGVKGDVLGEAAGEVDPGDLPLEPKDLPDKPIPYQQPVNVPVQPVNVPVQPANPTYLPANVPIQPVNQPGNPPVQPAQPGSPGNAYGPASTEQLYLQSTMPLGRPLPSRKTDRQAAVVRAFQHAWKGYREHAWGKDDLNPISHSSSSSYFNMGMTLVDSLDTIWLMGLEQEFGEAREWVAQSLDFDRNTKTVSLFETNIRVLGGLLSAYHLSQDRMFLDKAIKLGSRLLPAFQTPSGVPYSTVTLSNGGHGGRSISTAEAGTLQLEFRDLSRASRNPVYAEKCDRAMEKMLSQTRGIVLQSLNSNSGQYSGSVFSAGAGTDSYYEYLIKQWIQSGMTENKFLDAYTTAVPEVLDHLIGYSKPSHMAYLGKRFSLSSRQPPSPVMDHLSCFFPGMLALGAGYSILPDTRPIAENLTHTCYHMYHSTLPTGIAPEIFQFNLNPQGTSDAVRSSDSQNLQRPETVESLFYMYRLTKDERYREWGWEIFQAFEKYTKVEGGGYACLKSVYTPDNFRDRMESFFLSETLKYLYLLFGDDDNVLSLKEWVFNTEAHPLPIWRV